MNKDLLFCIILGILAVVVCIKSNRDFKLLSGSNPHNIYVNPRSFLYKGFIIGAVGISLPFFYKSGWTLPLISIVLVCAGLLNLWYLFKYKKINK